MSTSRRSYASRTHKNLDFGLVGRRARARDNTGMTYTTHTQYDGNARTFYVLEWRTDGTTFVSTGEAWRVVAGPYTDKAQADTARDFCAGKRVAA